MTIKPLPDDLISRFKQGIQVYYCYEALKIKLK